MPWQHCYAPYSEVESQYGTGDAMKKSIFLFVLCAFVFLSCGVVRVTGEFGDKYEFFLKVQLYPKFFFNDSIGMRDYQDLSTKEKQQYDMYCRVRFKSCDLPRNPPHTDSQ